MTLGQLSERDGQIEDAIGLFTRAHRAGPQRSGPRRRAAGGLPAGPGPAGVGRPGRGEQDRAPGRAAGRGRRPGPGALRLRPAVPALPGALRGRRWDHARVLADGFATRVGSARRGQAVGHGPVHRGGQGPVRRWPTGAPGSSRSSSRTGSPSTSAAACSPSTRSGTATARPRLAEVEATDPGHRGLTTAGTRPPVIRPAAVGLCALADRAWQARAAGDADARRAAVEAARDLIEIAREGAALTGAAEVRARRRRPRLAGPRRGRMAPGPGRQRPGRVAGRGRRVRPRRSSTRRARSRWRLAEALAEAGRRDEAQRELLLAAEAADRDRGQAAARGPGRPGPPGPAGGPARAARPRAHGGPARGSSGARPAGRAHRPGGRGAAPAGDRA